jgi:hypothetical protein
VKRVRTAPQPPEPIGLTCGQILTPRAQFKSGQIWQILHSGDSLHGRDQQTSSVGHCFHIPWLFSKVRQYLSQLRDDCVQTALEVNERVTRPQSVPQLFTSNHFTWRFQQRPEDTRRLLLKPHSKPVLP